MTTDFATITATDATNLIPDRAAAWLKANIAFAQGDHWQKGTGWSGPMLPNTNDGYGTMMANVETGFVAQNAIGEIVERHAAGVVGESPQKNVELIRPLGEDDKPTPAETELLDQARALLSLWWNGKTGVKQEDGRIILCSPHETLQAAVAEMLLTKRGVLRLAIPARLLTQNEETGETAVLAPASLEEAVGGIYLHHPASTEATVATDEETFEQGGVYSYKDSEEKQLVEIVFVNDGGRTVIRIAGVDDKGGDAPDGIDLDGRLTMHEMNRSLFVTETVRRLQKALNLSVTSSGRNIVSGGFLEREYFNTQMPGEWVADETAAGGTRFVPAKLNIGPNSANFLVGLPIYNDEGQITGYTNPQKDIHEPSSSEVFIKAADDYYHRILSEADQLHTIADSGAGASGEFIIQARSDFETSLKLSKTTVDAALTWCFDTVLALAAVLAGQPDAFAELKVSGSAIINTGPLSIGERELIVSAYDKRLLSRETAVRLIGAENVSAEIERINEEEGESLSLKKIQADMFKVLVADAQANQQAAAEFIGVDKETAAALARPNRLLMQDAVDTAVGANGAAAPGGADVAPENLESTKGLNGAQINAAKDLLTDVSLGQMADEVALELLISLGIERERAERMVNRAQQFTVATNGAGGNA